MRSTCGSVWLRKSGDAAPRKSVMARLMRAFCAYSAAVNTQRVEEASRHIENDTSGFGEMIESLTRKGYGYPNKPIACCDQPPRCLEYGWLRCSGLKRQT